MAALLLYSRFGYNSGMETSGPGERGEKMLFGRVSLARALQVLTFLVMGSIGAGTCILLTALLERFTALPPLLIVTIAFILATALSFVLQKFVTFRERRLSSAPGQFLAYFLFATLNLAINDLIVWGELSAGLRSLVIAQAVSSLLIAVYSFFVYRYGIFKAGRAA